MLFPTDDNDVDDNLPCVPRRSTPHHRLSTAVVPRPSRRVIWRAALPACRLASAAGALQGERMQKRSQQPLANEGEREKGRSRLTDADRLEDRQTRQTGISNVC